MPRPPHVLLLNATPDESDMYAWWLEKSGYCVSVVRDVAAVSRVAASSVLDVLVIDAMFAHPDTHTRLPEVLRTLSRRHGFSIITLSGYLPDSCAPQAGVGETCILKPCLPPHLSASIEYALWNSHQTGSGQATPSGRH